MVICTGVGDGEGLDWGSVGFVVEVVWGRSYDKLGIIHKQKVRILRVKGGAWGGAHVRHGKIGMGRSTHDRHGEEHT